MTNFDVIENQKSLVKKYLKILKSFKKISRSEIEKNVLIRGAIERYLYLAVQSMIDLAEAVVSYKKFRKPTTMSESFDILTEEKILPADLNETMIKIVGFRNVITHNYAKINYDVVYDILQNKLKDIEKFLKIIDKKI